MEVTSKQRYRRSENRERMRRRRARLQACGTGAAGVLRRQVNWLGWAPCRSCGGIFGAGVIEVDHTWPVGAGGCDTEDNVQTLCVPCHRVKTAIEATWP